jgi:anti-sigma factor RsiW
MVKQRDESDRMMSDAEIWRRGRDMPAPSDEAERFLALAAFAEGQADTDDREMVAAWLAHDPELAEDIAAASQQDTIAGPPPATVAARAAALIASTAPANNVIPFQPRVGTIRTASGWTSWGSLVAAMAVASWLGFTLGVDTSRSLAQAGQNGDEGFLREMSDPSPGFMRDLSDGAQS